MEDPVGVDSKAFIDEINGNGPSSRSGGCCRCCSSKFWVMSEVTYYRTLLVSHLFMLTFVGAGLFACVEGPLSDHVEVSSFFDSFYFVVVTITTVGYGDHSPETELGRICTMLIIMSALVVIPYRASMLSHLEYERSSPESELSLMDFNLRQLMELQSETEEFEEDLEPGSFLGYCSNCGGPRWTYVLPYFRFEIPWHFLCV